MVFDTKIGACALECYENDHIPLFFVEDWNLSVLLNDLSCNTCKLFRFFSRIRVGPAMGFCVFPMLKG